MQLRAGTKLELKRGRRLKTLRLVLGLASVESERSCLKDERNLANCVEKT